MISVSLRHGRHPALQLRVLGLSLLFYIYTYRVSIHHHPAIIPISRAEICGDQVITFIAVHSAANSVTASEEEEEEEEEAFGECV